MANHPTFMWQFVVSWLCVQSQPQSQSQSPATWESTFTLQSKVFHFPIWRRIRPLFEDPHRTSTSRTLSQFPTVVLDPHPFRPLPLPHPLSPPSPPLQSCNLWRFVWPVRPLPDEGPPHEPGKAPGGVADMPAQPAPPSQLAQLVHLFWFVWNNNRCLPLILFIVQIINAWQ